MFGSTILKFFSTLVGVICCTSIDVSKENSCKEVLWKKIFPCDYDKFVPPVIDGTPVIVYVTLYIVDVDEIKEDTMEFRIHVYMEEFWKDPRLKFDILNITTTFHLVPPDVVHAMWIPDTIFENSKWEKRFEFSLPNSAVRILPDQSLMRITRYSFLVGCQMDLHDYPMDVQHCGFKIVLFTEIDEKAVLRWSGDENSPYRKRGSIIFNEDIQPLKFEVKQPMPHNISEVWPDGTFSYLIANFTFVRRLTGNIVNIYIPSMLVVALSWLSFWLNVNAVPARVTLGVTSILTLVTQVVQSRTYVPPVNYIKALDIWLFICISIIAASLLEYAIAYHHTVDPVIHQSKRKTTDKEFDATKQNESVKLIKLCKHCQEKQQSTNLMLSVYQDEEASDDKKNEKRGNHFSSIESTNIFDYYSRFFFPVIFVAFVIGYWVYYLSHRISCLSNEAVEQR